MRAKTRAVAATAGAALVVVPLTGAAAAALVTQDIPTGNLSADSASIEDVAAADIAASVTAAGEAEYDVNTPDVEYSANPEPVYTPPPAEESTTDSAASESTSESTTSTSAAREVSQSSDVSAAISGSAVVAEASKYVGTPYVGGGSSPSGFDCSGLVSYVYGQLGISLPRTSGAYYNVGTRVSTPQPGDIIVSPGHVAIYAGPNLQIDAPRPGKSVQFRSIWQSNPTYVRVTG
ncbi:C40 family peptidase [Demequina sediminicola]|uniref:C40 family peptidase n=1 Tax=Demequina sediminicola TaxID=1095026 RepID=UPI000784B15D|nr:C40 family peptidase [Demequina sediminicola]